MPKLAMALAMIGPLPPSLVSWLTNSMFVLWPAAAARRSASLAMVGRRWYFSALCRLSTTCRMSSTNPSSPMNAFILAARLAAACSCFAQLARNSGVFMVCLFWGFEPGARRVSFGTDAENLEHAFQLRVAEKGNFHGAFATGVAQLDLGAEAFAKPVFQIGNVRVGRRGNGRAGLRAAASRFARLQPCHQPF